MLLPPFECCCPDEHGDEFWPSRPVSCAGHGRRPAQPSPFPAGLGGAGRRPHRPHSHWNHVYLQPGTRLSPRRSPGSSLLKREDRHRHQRCVQAKTNVCFSAAAFVPLKQLVLYRRPCWSLQAPSFRCLWVQKGATRGLCSTGLAPFEDLNGFHRQGDAELQPATNRQHQLAWRAHNLTSK